MERSAAATPIPASRLRFGILCDGPEVERWQAQCIEHLLAIEGIELALVVQKFPSARSRWHMRARLFGPHALWWLYDHLYVSKRSRARQRVDLTLRLARVPKVECRVTTDRHGSESLDDRDLETIRAYELDLMVKLGLGALRGRVLDAARLGVWSFRHSDEQERTGRPPLFWELYHGDPITVGSLERLEGPQTTREVLQRGVLKTYRHSFIRSLDSLYFAGVDWPAGVVRRLQAGCSIHVSDSSGLDERRAAGAPENRDTLRFAARLARNFAAELFEFVFRDSQWNVGIVEGPVQAFLGGERPPVRWLPEPSRTRCLADPFGIRQDGTLTLLVEDFDHRTRRGQIASIQASDEGRCSQPVAVIRAPVHLAYPYLVTHGDEVYCVPDMGHHGKEVALYRAVDFPGKWERVATLISDFAALDSTIFQHEDRWWLLCTNRETGADSKLYAWYADELMGPWVPHAANPLKIDIRSSRPAGRPFVHEGQLYRPAQDCSRTYGGAVTINRICLLTLTEFEEVPVARVEPYGSSRYPAGLHTLNGVGDLTLIDGKRRIFVYQAMAIKLRHIAQLVTRRLPARY